MRDAIALTCFFLSGVAGLIYEVCWIRRAGLVFGSTLYAVSTVLAIFFLGLALGSWLFGRIGQGSERPIRLYALLEVGLAALALLTIPAFDHAGGVYAALQELLPEGTAPGLLARLLLVTAVLLPPTLLMGGTLPLFCRQYVRERARITGSVGFLYAVNTYGAVLGAVLAGFVLLPTIGVRASIGLAAALNLLAGVVTASLRLEPPLPAPDSPGEPGASARQAWARAAAIGALVFLAGFTILGHEVVWTRYLRLLVRNTVYTYTITLSVVLVGIALGSLLAARLARLAPPARLFGALQVGIGLTVLATLSLPPAFWQGLGGDLWKYMLVLLPAPILSGASFPLAVRIAVDDPARAGIGVGRVTAINTVGGILGSLALGFVGLPLLGLDASIRLVTGLNLATGLAAWWLLDRERGAGTRALASLACVGVWILTPVVSPTRVPDDFLAEPGQLVDFREGLESHVAVLRGAMGTTLTIDRLPQGSEAKSHQVMAAHVPMLLHPDPKRVLVVGAGTGQTAARFLYYDIERLTCVDIEGAVFDLVADHFPSEWMQGARVSLVREDGRSVLARGDGDWDVISLELGQTFRPGVASFYTEDFYRLARARLAPDGLLSQFVPIQLTSPRVFLGLVASFLAVFPESVLWYNTTELLLIGRNGGPFEIDLPRLRARLAEPRIREDLRFSHWGDERFALYQPEVFLGGFFAGPATLAAIADGAPVFRDDRPLLEYLTSAPGEFRARVVEVGTLIKGRLSPIASIAPGLDAEGLATVRKIQEANLNDLAASALLVYVPGAVQSGDTEEARRLVAAALRANGENLRAQQMARELGVTP